MRRVLFVAYFFPPVGGAGVQRSVKFVRYLPEHGYEPVVVTGPGAAESRWAPLDETQANEVGAVAVRRVPGPVPPAPRGQRRRLYRLLGRSAFAPWWIPGVVQAGRSVRDADVIYGSLGPYESGEATAALARELGRPWVADLRDPWALDEMMVFPSALHRAAALRRMRNALASAAGIVLNTAEARRRLLAEFPELGGKVIATIPNGYDEADFSGPLPPRQDAAFRIVHTGYLHTDLGRRHRRTRGLRRLLGGSVPGVDILTRSHLFLLQAIDEVRRTDPELASRVELHLAGVLSAADRDEAQDAVVRVHGYVPHVDSTALLMTADLLFLPMQNLPAGRRATIVPGKTYEYLAARRPILAAIPEGDARDLLVEAGGARICRPDDVAAIAAALRLELAAWSSGAPRPLPDPQVVARFERRRQAQELARTLDEVLAGS